MKFLIQLSITFLALTSAVTGHSGPDPLVHYDFQKHFVDDQLLIAQRGPDLKLPQKVSFSDSLSLQTLELTRPGQTLAATDRPKRLPVSDFTIEAWCSVDVPREYGGLISAFQDNGSSEHGWVLGYNKERFSIALATEGGQGKMTYLTGKTPYELGRFYHVAATYDGTRLSLYVNGKLEATSTEQSGDIRYPESYTLNVGGYKDHDEDFPHLGRLRSIRVWDVCATAAGVAHTFEHQEALAAAAPELNANNVEQLSFVVAPYLQFVTTSGITVMCESSDPSIATLHYGPTAECVERIKGPSNTLIHELRIEGLDPDTQYFYYYTLESAQGITLSSEVKTFQTAPLPGNPITFAIISDTQTNPNVASKVAKFAWGQRPHFLLHPGDLVGTGSNKAHWTQQFFPSMKPLIERVAFFPVLGNHEQNARHYYNYVSLPKPEYYYTFTYGDAQFFMLDTNKKVDQGTEQYEWLKAELAKSTARWKFVCHHHPVYSSDENDYGNLWKTNESTRGHPNAQKLSELYDYYGVDVVWNGHIHSYERTWPVKGGKATRIGEGTVYMITGGGGGPLETPGPSRPFFQNTVRHGHHYSMARINGDRLEFFAYDVEGRLFDTMIIQK